MLPPRHVTAGKILPWLSLFALMTLVYYLTLAPGVYGFDSGELATGVFVQGIVHPPGYPLYLLIGKIFTLLPIKDIAYRLNLMSAFFGALTVVLLYSALLQLTVNRTIAWLTAAVFGFSNYFWQGSLVAEVYTLHTALLAGNLALLFYWRNTGKQYAILLFALLYGLSLTNHTSGILFAPGFVWIVITSRYWSWKAWKQMAGMLFFFLIGLAVYLYLPLRAHANPPLNYVANYYNIDLSTPAGLFWMVSGQAYRIFSFDYQLSSIPEEVIYFANGLWRNFLGAGVLVGLIGVFTSFKKRPNVAVGILLSFLITAVFYINYRVADKDTMFLPVYLCWAVFLFEGLLAVERWLVKIFGSFAVRRNRVLISTLLLFIFLPAPFLNWKWVNMREENSFSEYARAILSTAHPDAVVIAPWSYAVVLEYYQVVYQQRPDIEIINSSRVNVATYYQQWVKGYTHEEITRIINTQYTDLIRADLNLRPVYSLEYDSALASQFEYQPVGFYFRLDEKGQAMNPGSFQTEN